MSLAEKVSLIPTRTGVYLMKGSQGEILYVGKAKNLRARLRSYFRGSSDGRPRISFLIAQTKDLEFVLTESEKEALILENNLIKKHRPRYNVLFRDDKTYVSLKLTVKEKFSRLTIVRKVKKDGSLYFGPYASRHAVLETLRVADRLFPLRSCTPANFKNRTRPCLYHQMHKCLAPCVGLVDESTYRQYVQGLILFLRGQNRLLLRILRQRMVAAAAAEQFEDAARLRNQTELVKKTFERQRALSVTSTDRDVFGLCREGSEVEIQVLYIRGGKLLGGRSYPFSQQEAPDAELISSFLVQFYHPGVFIPEEVILPVSIEDRYTLSQWLSENKGKKVVILCPRRGEKKQLVEMALLNANAALRQRLSGERRHQEAIADLQRCLHLPSPAQRIEAFDISNLGGRLAVGSMAVLLNGSPATDQYRHYKIKTVFSPDDYTMMEEVLRRRYKRLVEENQPHPDLIVVDGGKGQLNIAVAALKEFNLDRIPVIALAKERELLPGGKSSSITRRHRGTQEKVYLPQRKNPLLLPRHSLALHLLQRIRDEAHRFAITYHKKLRHKRQVQSVLDEIPGVGPKRHRALLAHFGSLEQIRQASAEELRQVPGISAAVAQNIVDYLQRFT